MKNQSDFDLSYKKISLLAKLSQNWQMRMTGGSKLLMGVALRVGGFMPTW